MLHFTAFPRALFVLLVFVMLATACASGSEVSSGEPSITTVTSPVGANQPDVSASASPETVAPGPTSSERELVVPDSVASDTGDVTSEGTEPEQEITIPPITEPASDDSADVQLSSTTELDVPPATDPTTTTTTAAEQTTTTFVLPDLASIDVQLEAIDGDFDKPIALVDRSGEPSSVYVAERDGTVRRVRITDDRRRSRDFEVDEEPFLDLTDEIGTDGEGGLLDIEFSSDGRRLYLSYTDQSGTSVIDEMTMAVGDFDEPELDPDSRRVVLRQPQPFSNHNGGDIEFGPDGFLYVAFGDGGAGGDPQGNGQNPTTLLGSILRIDPEGASGLDTYGIPASNPFIDGASARPEVFIYGARNPWRMSFDAQNGDLWIGDVGQNRLEEINRLPADTGGGRAANLGWNRYEANEPFEGGTEPSDHVGPLFAYGHSQGRCSVTGGVVYRGSLVPQLDGVYLYGDYCESQVRALVASPDGAQIAEGRIGIGVPSTLVSFGTDSENELYVLSLESSEIFRLRAG